MSGLMTQGRCYRLAHRRDWGPLMGLVRAVEASCI